MATGDSGRVGLRVLGTVAISVDEVRLKLTAAEKQIVAILVAAGPDGVDQHGLADELWGDRLPKTWQASLRNQIAKINAKAGRGLITPGRSDRALDIDPAEVDAWRLLDAGQATIQNLRLLAGVPFSGVDITPQLRLTADRIAAKRLDLLIDVARNRIDVDRETLSLIRRLVDEDPFDVETAKLAIDIHQSNGDSDGARAIADTVGSALEGFDIKLPHAADAGPSIRPELAMMDSTLKAYLDTEWIGSSLEIDQLASSLEADARPGLILEGPSGAGKTRLAAEIASRLFGVGHNVRCVTATEFATATLQPFIEGFNDLGPIVTPFLATRLDDPADQARCWISVLQWLDATTAGRPMCLVVDDGQWLDAASVALLGVIARSELAHRVRLIVAGRPIDGQRTWQSLAAQMEGAGCARHAVAGLEVTDVQDLVAVRLGADRKTMTAVLGEQIHRRARGIAGVVLALADEIDGDNPLATLDSRSDSVTGYSALAERLDEGTRRVGLAAAVLGQVFSIPDLAELTGRSPEGLIDAVERLVAAGAVMERPRPHEWEFVHVLSRDAFRLSGSRSRRAQLHGAALELTHDVHERAWHAWEARYNIEPERLSHLLSASAQSHFAGGNHAEAARLLLQLESQRDGGLDLIETMALAESLDRTGQPASKRRSDAVAMAVAASEGHLALAASSGGLPTTERLDGDRDRLELIGSIPVELLEAEDRIHRDVLLSRQHLLLGEMAQAKRLAGEAFASTDHPGLRAAAWVAIRHAEEWSPLDDELPLDWISKVTNPVLRRRVDEARMVAELARGISDEACSGVAELVSGAQSMDDPTSLWFSLLMQTTVETDLGDLIAARLTAAEAEQIGYRFGVAGTEAASNAQRFLWALLAGQHPGFVDLFLPAVEQDRPTSLILAGLTLALDGAGRRVEAARSLELTMDRARLDRFGLATTALVSQIATRYDRALAAEATERLQPRRGTHILVGSGLADLGPCSRLLAALSLDVDRKRALLSEAIEQVDTGRAVLWQVICRRDLAAIVGAAERRHLEAAASERATTPWLRVIAETPSG